MTLRFALLCGLSFAAASIAAEPPFTLKFKRESDSAAISVDKDQTVLAIRSPFGISEATVTRTGERPPAKVVLRLYLAGLEHFQVANDATQLAASVSSSDAALIRVWKDGHEDRPLDAKDPWYLAIRRFDAAGKPSPTAVRDGYFEVELPQALWEKNPKSITLRWIDFYRN